jgi:hypothetical protein
MGDSMVLASLNSVVKNCGGTNTTTGQASVYGTHFWDAFTSDTAGRVILSMNEPTAETTSLVSYVTGTPKFTSAGQLTMQTANDEVIIEQSYFVKGCTALTNTAPIITGTNVTYSSGARWGNHDIYYQIDTGSGYSGTWKDLTAVNLSGESINASTGFKIKYRIVTATSATNNAITYIRITTDSTLASQTDNLYPLDTVTISVDDVVAGSSVKISKTSDGTVLFNEVISGTSKLFSTEYTGQVSVELRKASASPYYKAWYTIVTIGTGVTVNALQERDDL